MEDITIKGKFTVEGMRFKNVRQPLKYLSFKVLVPYPVQIEGFTSYEEKEVKMLCRIFVLEFKEDIQISEVRDLIRERFGNDVKIHPTSDDGTVDW